MLAAVSAAQSSQPATARRADAPWVVSVVHTTELDKMLARMREQEKVRIGVRGQAPQFIYNVTTGLVLDNRYIITRLPNLDPQEKEPKITVTASNGETVQARLVGVDGATGFVILEADSLRIALPVFAPSMANGTTVNILSADVEPKAASVERASQVYFAPSIKVMQGQIRTDSLYSRARNALTLISTELLSRNDSSIVITTDNKVVGVAQYAGYGRAYVFPVELLRNTIARRVIDKKASVPGGWLGLKGDSLTKLADAELATLGVNRKVGVVVREITPGSPAAQVGIKVNDIIVGVDDLDIVGEADLVARVSSSPAGQPLKLRAIRDTQPVEIDVVLGARPLTATHPSPLPLEQAWAQSVSQEAQIRERLAELGAQYQKYYFKMPDSKKRTEALGELQMEIRQLQDIIRGMEEEKRQRQGMLPSFASNEPPSAVPDTTFDAGFSARDLSPQLARYLGTTGGMLVTSVTVGSRAETAGMKVGDVIVGIGDDQQVSTGEQLQSLLAASAGSIRLKIIRKKQPLLIAIEK